MSKQPVIHLKSDWKESISEEDLIFALQTKYDETIIKYGDEDGFKEQYDNLLDDWGMYKHYMQIKYNREFPELKHTKIEYNPDNPYVTKDYKGFVGLSDDEESVS